MRYFSLKSLSMGLLIGAVFTFTNSSFGFLENESDELLMLPLSHQRVDSQGVSGFFENPIRQASYNEEKSDGTIIQVSGGSAAPNPNAVAIPRAPGANNTSGNLVDNTPVRPRPTAEGDAAVHDHPPVRCASFLKVTAGETTVKELKELWGEPKKTTKLHEKVDAFLYSFEGFNHIEILTFEDVVQSVAINLAEPLPSGQVREELSEALQKSKPIMIADENGDVLGHVFPEKGVKFVFAPSEKAGVASNQVTRIAIEPIEAEPFVLRAEGYLKDLPSSSHQDLTNALKLETDNPKAYWLLSQIELARGNNAKASEYCEKAIEIDEMQLQYHVTMAKIIAQHNHTAEAKAYLEAMLTDSEKYPSIHASALCLLGDLYQIGSQADFDKASTYHQAAAKVASEQLGNANPTTRMNAKDTFLHAYLGVAKDVAWGKWSNNGEQAARRWVEEAKQIIKDPELSSNKPGTKDYPLKLAIAELVVNSEFPSIEIGPYVQNVLSESAELINRTDDPIQKMKYQWETGLALYNAGRVYQSRGDSNSAIKYCDLAARFLDGAMKNRTENLQDTYMMARVRFRLGSMYAIGKKDHNKAIECYNSARPMFERAAKNISADELGSLGDTFITMGVSYWTVGQQEQGLTVSLQGTKFIETAVEAKLLNPSSLVIPYRNLATMYRKLNQLENANRYQERAEQIQTAAMPKTMR